MSWIRWMALLAGIVLGFADGAQAQGGGQTQTRFPIVLQPGLANLGFFGVASDLRAGGARVFETQSDGFNNSSIRGQQLVEQIEDILAITGAQKVNLIGHSQGPRRSVRARHALGAACLGHDGEHAAQGC